jgi:dipeptidyl aminopeptidase/acylaminoacyl peptidase
MNTLGSLIGRRMAPSFDAAAIGIARDLFISIKRVFTVSIKFGSVKSLPAGSGRSSSSWRITTAPHQLEMREFYSHEAKRDEPSWNVLISLRVQHNRSCLRFPFQWQPCRQTGNQSHTVRFRRALYVSRRNGTQKRSLTDPNMEAALPAWSPDGTQIAFMSRVRGLCKVYVVPTEGGPAKPLVESSQIEVRDPTWSDGKQILVGYGPTIPRRNDSTSLYIVDVGSGKLDHQGSGSDGLFSPRWSPDGKYIAALSADASRLLIYNPQTGWRPVVENAKLGYPTWSADGHVLYVLDETGFGNVIRRIRIPALKIETAADLAGYQQPRTIFGSWIGIDGNSPLFVKDMSTRMIGAFKYTEP